MINCRFLLLFLRDGLRVLLQVARNFLRSRQSLVLENLALRSQLALFELQVVTGKRAKPQPTPTFHRLWSWLSRTWPDWRMALLVVTPAAVIRWHRQGFRWYWARLSQPRGHLVISRATIALIKRVHLVSLG